MGEATGDSALDTEDSRTESALDTLVLPSPESARVAGLESEPKLRRVTDLSLVPELEGAGGAGRAACGGAGCSGPRRPAAARWRPKRRRRRGSAGSS